MNVTLDWGNILVMLSMAAAGFVYNTLRGRIDDKVRVVSQKLNDEIIAVHERLNRTDHALAAIPVSFEKVASQLQRIELQLANNHPTKEELKASIDQSNQRLTHIESAVRELSEGFAKLSARQEAEAALQRRSRRTR